MSYTMEDFQKDYVREHLGVLAPEERIKGLSPAALGGLELLLKKQKETERL